MISQVNGDFSYFCNETQKIIYDNKTIFTFNSRNYFHSRTKKITFIVLAAKEIADNFPYETAFAKIYEQIMHFDLVELIFILGYKNDEMRRYIHNKFDRIIIARNYNSVIYSSFKQALYAVSDDSDWFVMHFLKNYSRDISFVNDMVSVAKKQIIVPQINGQPTHPLIFRKNIMNRLKSVRKEFGFPYILNHFSDDIEYIEVYR